MLIFSGAVIAFSVYMVWYQRANVRALYEPKFLAMRVGGVPVPERPGKPIEVMADLPVDISCEVVKSPDKNARATFRVIGPGVADERDQCDRSVVFPGPPGTRHKVVLEYLLAPPGVAKGVIDRKEADVVVVPVRQFFRIRALATAKGELITTHTVPQAVIPYAEAALDVEAPDDLSVLFFVRKVGSARPILQVVVPPEAPAAWRVNLAPLKRFRSPGGRIVGYAAWPGGVEPGGSQLPDPIQIGNDSELRQAFEVFAGLFRKADVERVRKTCLTFRHQEGGRVVFDVQDVTIDTIRQLAHQGWLTPPLVVVRSNEAPSETGFAWSAR